MGNWMKLNSKIARSLVTAVYGGVLAAVETNRAWHCICKSKYEGGNTLNKKEAINFYWDLFLRVNQ